MNFTEKITIPKTVLSQIVDDEMVLLDTQSENYFGLDAIGADMWQILVNNRSVEHLKTVMLQKYDVQEERLVADIEVFISNLLKHQLVTIGEA